MEARKGVLGIDSCPTTDPVRQDRMFPENLPEWDHNTDRVLAGTGRGAGSSSFTAEGHGVIATRPRCDNSTRRLGTDP
ncbi:uncharacterized protein [Petaurus breviceps papuanus]|uniref:uncharacterized protein isoform X2 n=1 Tax=Petaurus breviceps papuanus TaxID=3040969 RepID=UPI0036DCB8C9